MIINKKIITSKFSTGLIVFTVLMIISCFSCRKPGNTVLPETINVSRGIKPQDGAVWMEDEGIRAAWLEYDLCSVEMLNNMAEAKCNVLMLSHNIADFLNLSTAHWQEDKLIVDYNRKFVDTLLKITREASDRDIRTLFISTLNLKEVLPTLERLGYERAYIEGPTRFISAGLKEDASPFDKTLWEGLIGAHGEHIARLSLEYPIEAVLYDTEHYEGGIMYLQGSGFGDDSFTPYLREKSINKTAREIPSGTRYEYLKENGLLYDYWNYLEEKIYLQGRILAKRWRTINPNLILGIWVLFDNWYSHGLLRGLGGEVPSLGLSHCEYFSGSYQTKSMAEYFERRIPNMKYMPGFMNRYVPDDLEYHVAQAIEATGGRYWMLAPTSYLTNPVYKTALSNASEQGQKVKTAYDLPAIDLDFTVIHNGNEPFLVVRTSKKKNRFQQQPLITLRGVRGGAALCKNLPMEYTNDGYYQVKIHLVRLLTDNLYQKDVYRSGVCYEYNPVPLRIMGEDTHHTKLFDGRAYGFAGTTAIWDKDVNHAEVIFDLHRDYKITRVALSQPNELEDGYGGPAKITLDLGGNENEFIISKPLTAHLPLADNYRPLPPEVSIDDEGHQRAWLNWFAEDINMKARWLRIRMERRIDNIADPGIPDLISLGEVMIWGTFSGEIQASVTEGDSYRLIQKGKRFTVPE